MGDISTWLESFYQSLSNSGRAIEAYLPYLALAALLMIIGWIAARVLRAIVVRLGGTINGILGRARKPSSTSLRLSTRLIAVVGTTVFWITILVFVGFAVQSAVVLTAAVIGLDQIGFEVTFLIILVAVLVGGIALSIALTFGIGACDLVSNLIASHQTRRIIERGESARIGETEGRVLEFTPTSVVLITERGRLLVPAKLSLQHATLILSDEDIEQ